MPFIDFKRCTIILNEEHVSAALEALMKLKNG